MIDQTHQGVTPKLCYNRWVEKRPTIGDKKTLHALFKINFQGSFGDLMWCRSRNCSHVGPVEFFIPFIRNTKRWSFALKCPRCSRASNVLGMLNVKLLDEMQKRSTR